MTGFGLPLKYPINVTGEKVEEAFFKILLSAMTCLEIIYIYIGFSI